MIVIPGPNGSVDGLVGIESGPVVKKIEKRSIELFADAIGDPNPLFTDEILARQGPYGGLVAPPTFLRSIIPKPLPIKIGYPYTAKLDGGSEWEYFEPVRLGDLITHFEKIIEVYKRNGRLGNMLFVIREGCYINQFKTLVVLERSTGIYYTPAEDDRP
ncbi:MAG: MaoC family dehydratase N-terminal domain-containing protein [Chloroflexota bacterium]|nr:MaoC family dehydratase N-terminal domain-containing protein [Chloroflexota bacterium]